MRSKPTRTNVGCTVCRRAFFAAGVEKPTARGGCTNTLTAPIKNTMNNIESDCGQLGATLGGDIGEHFDHQQLGEEAGRVVGEVAGAVIQKELE